MTKELEHILFNTVIDAKRRRTPGEVEKAVAEASGVDKKTVRLAIRSLVGAGVLSYTYIYGTSFLERSFDRPVRVSKRIVLKPPDKAYEPKADDVVIALAGGAAFGNGAHPTTCLALEALDCVLDDNPHLQSNSPLTGLDVGTGTGVLAIALARLGFEDVVGTDIDPCAISEARQNVSLNGLSEQVMIYDIPVGDLKGAYSVILANLAFPTLKRMSSVLAGKLAEDGLLILSGFKGNVSADLAKTYAEHGLRLVREDTERDWVCMTLYKRGA